ncbi:hypothetical protein [Janibacter melonis]|nr:hypothetical protein [Janibacter melonis]
MGVSQGLHHVIDAASIAGSDVVSLTMIGGGNQTEPLADMQPSWACR